MLPHSWFCCVPSLSVHTNLDHFIRSALGFCTARQKEKTGGEKEDDRQKEKQREVKGKRGLGEIRAYPKTDIQLNVDCDTFP